jgi:acetoin utilization deacetylase AcuC-like enzyme
VEAALRAAGGAVALVDALLAARRVGVSALRPPGHHAERDARWVLLLRQRRGRGARTRARLERVLIVDWDVHHGNGTNDIFHADPDVLFVSIHESPLYPGRARRPTSGRARARASRSTCRCPAERATRVSLAVEHVARR